MLNLEYQLGLYRKYHYNPLNVLIHVIFVPTILFSSFLIVSNIPLLPNLSPPHASIFNLGTAAATAYGIFYLLLDPLFGAPSLVLLPLLSYFLAQSVWLPQSQSAVARLLASTPILASLSPTLAAVCLFFLGWTVQFLGHGVFEKRAPAVLDNLLQPLVLAPFFVLFEIAVFFGFRKDIMEKVDKQVLPEVKLFHQQRQNA